MALAHCFGRVTLRPVRVGLAIGRGSIEGFRRAVELATSSWGGIAYPILECASDAQSALDLAEAFDVDVIAAVEATSDCQTLAERPGFQWRDALRRDPFDRDDEVVPHSVLGADVVAEFMLRFPREAGPARLLTWNPDHPLADVLTMLFGRFGDRPADRRLASMWARFDTSHLDAHTQVPADSDWMRYPSLRPTST